MKSFQRVIFGLVELLWPSQCVLCRGPIGLTPVSENPLSISDSLLRELSLCSECFGSLEFLSGPTCRRCSHPLAPGQIAGLAICPDCYRNPPPFERVLAPFVYSGTVRELIHLYKYGGELSAGKTLASLFVRYLEKIEVKLKNFSYICPVPSSRRRILSRGFDHIWLLAKVVSKRFSALELIYPLVKSDSPPQMTLELRRRVENARSTISINSTYRQKFYRKGVILIDDVYSSGSTARVCSELLLNSGASRVLVLVLSRGRMRSLSNFESIPK